MVAEVKRLTRREILDMIDEVEQKLISLTSALTDERVANAASVVADNAVAIMEVIPTDDFKTMHAALMCLQLGKQISRLNLMKASD